MNNFFPLTVKELKKVTSDSVSITFDVPDNLKEQFDFKEGQYITLKKEIKGENIQRAYSIWKAPYENVLSVLVKKVENGIFRELFFKSLNVKTFRLRSRRHQKNNKK